MTERLKRFPRLYRKVTDKERITTYLIYVTERKDGVCIVNRVSGTLGGVQTNAPIEVIQGVNLGKANETSIRAQANRVAETVYNRLLDDGYKQTIEELKTERTNDKGFILPMLAQKWRGDMLPYWLAQPKLDGARTLTRLVGDKIVQYTRKAKPLNTLGHLNFPDRLKVLMEEGYIVDGEAYVHGYPFEDFVSAYKAYQKGITEQITYMVYDIFHPDKKESQEYRLFSLLAPSVNGLSDNIFFVPSRKVFDVAEVNKLHDEFVRNGYEGLMLRDPHSSYKPGLRSSSLVKVKRMIDEEFTIVNVYSAGGKDAGTALFTCATEDGDTFEVRPQGSFAQRKKYLEDRLELIGASATVTYQGMTKYGKPRFPTLKAIRDYE
jgi:ATP-dependent DNA ligase